MKRMFSGIVERTAEVVAIRTDRQNKDFTLRADFCKELKIDQSIAHNGVCLTVVDITEDTYTVTAMKETLDRSNLVVPPVGACDLAMCYTGRAMGALVPPGTVVLLKAVDRDAIIPGGEYAIVSRKIVTLRIVRAADEEDKVRLVAGDRENYDDILLNVSDIVAVYKVKGKLIINS